MHAIADLDCVARMVDAAPAPRAPRFDVCSTRDEYLPCQHEQVLFALEECIAELRDAAHAQLARCEQLSAMIADTRCHISGRGAAPKLHASGNIHGDGTLGHRPDCTVSGRRLTAREAEVLQLISAGQSNRQIAASLFVSARTVERHIANIYLKIDAHSKADATAYAFRHGLVTVAAT